MNNLLASASKKRSTGNLLAYLSLTLGSIIMLMPFFWMIATSFKSTTDSYKMTIIPEVWTVEAYQEVFFGDRIQSMFGRWYINSFVVTGIAVLSAAFFCSLAGYAFSKFRFPGRTILFILVISTMMIPIEMLIIPWFQMMVNWGWVNSFQGLLFPFMMSGFGIFLMKQFIDGVPDDLIDAARVDGMSEFGIFIKIVIPLVKPAIAALAILTFLGTWNAYLWPIIVTNQMEMWTVAMGIGSLYAEVATEANLQMAAATIASIPILIIFILFQRQIIEGISLTGIKG